MSDNCRNKVVIEISVSELMKARVAIGQLAPFLSDVEQIVKYLHILVAGGELNKDDWANLEEMLYDNNVPLTISETKKSLWFLSSLFSYDEND